MDRTIPETPSPFDLLVLALKLTYTVPTLKLAEEASEIAERIARDCQFSELEQAQAKAIAMAAAFLSIP